MTPSQKFVCSVLREGCSTCLHARQPCRVRALVPSPARSCHNDSSIIQRATTNPFHCTQLRDLGWKWLEALEPPSSGGRWHARAPASDSTLLRQWVNEHICLRTRSRQRGQPAGKHDRSERHEALNQLKHASVDPSTWTYVWMYMWPQQPTSPRKTGAFSTLWGLDVHMVWLYPYCSLSHGSWLPGAVVTP